MRAGPALFSVALVASVLGCARDEPTAPRPGAASVAVPAAAPAPAHGCTRLPFAPSVDLAEASGAVYVAADGAVPAHVVVVADSGNHGAFVVVDASSGAELGRGTLPLDPAASDDVEGFGRMGDDYVALTSSGAVRHFHRDGLASFVLSVPSYAIGPRGPNDDLVCRSPLATNCGRNWEGLCLRAAPPPDGGCAGFAASKRDGALVCLTWQGGRLHADPSRSIAITHREALSGCAIVDDLVYAGTNLFDAGRVYRVRGAADPKAARLEPLGPLGAGFPEEVAAAPDGTLYRFSDLGVRPSAMDRFRCE